MLTEIRPAESHQKRMLSLFRLSVLKQRKWSEIIKMLGPTRGLKCLDIGSDNGVISYLLRKNGGDWVSADLDAETVDSIQAMVGKDVLLLDPERSGFPDGHFDRIVVIDGLEHVRNDEAFARELERILKPGGEIIFNVPTPKNSLLRKFRLAIGQTDAAHGHVRHGYSSADLACLCGPEMSWTGERTYSKFFSELIDTILTWGIRRAKKPSAGQGVKGTVVTGKDVAKHDKLLMMYAAVYPFFWLFAQLDRLLWFRSGYMLIARARRSGSSSSSDMQARETPDIETSSENYARRFSGPSGKWMLEVQEKAMLRLLSERLGPGASILEVGGGHGQLTGALLAKGWNVTVFGSDESCRSRIERWRSAGCRFQAGDLLSLPYADHSFDAVVSIRLLPHVMRWPKLVREMTRVAGRLVAVDYPTKRSANFMTPLLFGAKKKLEGNTRDYLLFDEADLARHFNDEGFALSGRIAQFFLPMVFHRVLKSPQISAAIESIFRFAGLTRWFGSPVLGRFERRPAR